MLEDQIRARLMSDANITDCLALFDNEPAIFYQRAAPDTSSGWGDEQYPRIDYTIDTRADPSRNAAGTLYINVWCTLFESPVEPGEIEGAIRTSLHRSIVQDADIPACVITWEQSNNFEGKTEGERGKDICGYTLRFRISSMPGLATTDPCPILGLNQFTKGVFPDTAVIGLDTIDGWLDDDKTAVYWEVKQMQIRQRTNVCCWYNVTAVCTIYCKDDADKTHMAAVLEEHLGCEDHVTLADTSPLFVRDTKVLPASTGTGTGQVMFDGWYGVLLYHHNVSYHPEKVPNPDPINHMGADTGGF